MMVDPAREIAEFDARIAEMNRHLAARRVIVEKKDYRADAFGSWHLVAGDEKKKIDFSCDGKDSYLMFRDASVTPQDHRDLEHKRFQTWKGEDPIAFVEDVLLRKFPER